jgi:two-component system cell cycle sensor histidine kinase/response regulator CckA
VPNSTPHTRGSGTILVVDDEAGVRSLVRLVLEEAGYTVLEAGNGQEALSKYEQFEGPLDLLITDSAMPKMTGRQVAEQLVLSHPEMKVLFISGHMTDAIVLQAISQGRAHFLQKPFAVEILKNTVRQLLEKKQA